MGLKMWRSALVFLTVLTICYCQHHGEIVNLHVHKKKHHKKHHALLYGGGLYLIFWLIKLKVIFVLGTIFAMFVFAGKMFALVKFMEYKKHAHHEPEKIYIQDHGHSYDFSDHHDSGAFSDHPPSGPSDYSPGGPYSGYGRSINEKDAASYENYDMFARMIRRLNITEMAFDSMHLKTDNCKRKFVCEADYNGKNTVMLKSAFDLLSDESYNKYKTNKNVTSFEECATLYPNCPQSVLEDDEEDEQESEQEEEAVDTST